MVSYDDCGASAKVEDFCIVYREMRRKPIFDADIRHIYEETAGSLAADRQTRTLPVVLAEFVFIGGWVISLVKATSSEPNPTNWINVEAQSIAISALFLWVTSAVVIASVIGASQTEDAVPRILHAMEYHLAAFRDERVRRPSIEARIETEWCRRSIDRAINGGTYAWRPIKWAESWTDSGVHVYALFTYTTIGTLVVGSSFFVSALLSYLVSPRGFNCRHIPEALILIIWLLSTVVEIICERCLDRKLFWAIFWKDTLSALCSIAIILLVQWGIMNRCSCWSGWGSTGLHLPQMPEVKPELMYFIRHIAPWIVTVAVAFHFIFCAGIVWKYWDAVRVYVQRDDGVSNLGWENRRREKSRVHVSEHELESQ
ncbi:Nn.00g063250.m01.CDS01 [Neocucurbitaria sp. VM-36]